MSLHVFESWRSRTRNSYNVYLKKFEVYAFERDFQPLETSIENACDFLCGLFLEGYSYSALGQARSALSAVLPEINGKTFGEQKLTRRVMKSFYDKNPPRSKYFEFWDPDVPLTYLREYTPNIKLSVFDMTVKLCFLLAILSAQRCQTLADLKVDDFKFANNERSVTLLYSTVLKNSRVGQKLGFQTLEKFDEDPTLCIVTNIQAYLFKTRDIRAKYALRRDGGPFFVGTRPPYQGVTAQTVSKWIRRVLSLSGISTKRYGAHSTRGVSGSVMVLMNVPIKEVLERAAWKSESTFRVFYHKPITKVANPHANAILQRATDNRKSNKVKRK